VTVGADRWTVDVDGATVTAALDAAPSPDAPVFLLAHGAGGRMDDRGVVAVARQLHACGLQVVRFNFPYSERGTRRPDPMPVLQACIAAVASRARAQIDSTLWLLGGRSMGGRAASMLAALGYPCDGVLLLAYPLHPAGKPDKLRDSHLRGIAVPVLCLNGTNDPLCRRDLMDAVVGRLPATFRMHWLEGADHAFHVTRATGRTDADVLAEIGAATTDWVAGISRPAAAGRRSLR
jgi:predicted alpha/beta-hydrolase family hydrolase